ncbi:histone H1-like [Phoenix dactylifera]|uniref:Histone H1-like n=1 Tax=Phoenix dactylifera TaxID=42345 RepID=A0A8B7BIP2_PHODC|nr:histone H1-like [Phoenix dactylifera]
MAGEQNTPAVVEEKVQDSAPAEPAVEDPSAKAVAKSKKAKEPKAKKPSAPRKPRSPPTHPPYIEIIGEAITALKERTGSSQYSITKFIEDKYKAQVPPNFRKLLLLQLKTSGKLNKIKNSYKLPPSRPKSAFCWKNLNAHAALELL